jgi:hypothetical protein
MSRQVLTADVVIPAGGYLKVERRLKKGQVVELNATEISEIGAGSLRVTSTANVHDQLGEAFAAAN